jgi:sec-independent protein translocase protein TatA
MFGLRTPELLVILAVVLVLFGGSRLPQLGKSLGSAMRGFKKSISEDEPEALPPPRADDRPKA